MMCLSKNMKKMHSLIVKISPLHVRWCKQHRHVSMQHVQCINPVLILSSIQTGTMMTRVLTISHPVLWVCSVLICMMARTVEKLMPLWRSNAKCNGSCNHWSSLCRSRCVMFTTVFWNPENVWLLLKIM